MAVLAAPLSDADLDELRKYISNVAQPEGHDHLRLLAGRRMVYNALRILVLSDALGMEDLSRVMSFIQVSRFMYLDRRLDEAHATVARAVRSALAQGLHRDGTRFGFDTVTVQLRRVIWAIACWLDKHFSFVVGRPSAIVDMTRDTQPPEDVVWQEEWPYIPGQRSHCSPKKWNDLPVPPASVPRPTCMAYSVIGAHLASWCKISSCLFKMSHLKPTCLNSIGTPASWTSAWLNSVPVCLATSP